MLSDAILLIKNKSTAIRTESDLDLIRTTFDEDLSKADTVWAALSNKQKNTLCKYFEFKAALSDDGDLYPCVDKAGIHWLQYNPAGIFILVRGEAIVSTGEHSIVIRGGGSMGVDIGVGTSCISKGRS